MRRKNAGAGSPRIDVVLIDSLTQRWQKYLKELRRCRRSFSEEAVHDLRVATRRLVSTLLMVEIVLPDPRARRLRKRLKRLFDALSPLRDTQVQLLVLEKEVARYPDIETLITILKVRERTQLGSVRGRIEKIETAALGAMVASLKKALRGHFSRLTIKRAGMHAVMGTAANRFVTAALHKERVVPEQPGTIHRARVAFKKFRYTVEALAPLLPAINNRMLKAMDTYQTRMGNIQDAEVLGALVRRFAEQSPPALRRKLAPFRRELLARKKEHTARYRASSDELYRFWKSVPSR